MIQSVGLLEKKMVKMTPKATQKHQKRCAGLNVDVQAEAKDLIELSHSSIQTCHRWLAEI